MEVSEMRSKIAKAYIGDKWKARVKKMSEYQVMAIYYSLKKRGAI